MDNTMSMENTGDIGKTSEIEKSEAEKATKTLSDNKASQSLAEKWKVAILVYLYYFKIGWYTFGGGWSIVAQMQRDFVEDRKEITSEELLDIVSVGRSLPGTMIGNVSFLFGYYKAGIPGGVMGVLGIITPPLIILTIITFCYTNVKDNIWIARALNGVRAVVAPIILSAVLKLHKGAFPKKFCYVITIVGCIALLFFNVNSVVVIVFGIIMGLMMSLVGKEKK